MYEDIFKLWQLIAVFEKNERKNDSTNPILANARQGARMTAYTALMERQLDGNLL